MIWFTSDPHFWHRKVIEYCGRPFESLEAMHEALITNWNACVMPGDTIYVLGDFAFAGATKIKEIVPRLEGHKVLIMGNHDWHFKPHRWVEFGFEAAFSSWALDAKVPGGIIQMSHFPYAGAGDQTVEERYTESRLPDDGLWLAHGHVHTHWKQKSRMINVGVDQWGFKPVALSEIEEMTWKQING